MAVADINCDDNFAFTDALLVIQAALVNPLSDELDADEDGCPDSCVFVVDDPCEDAVNGTSCDNGVRCSIGDYCMDGDCGGGGDVCDDTEICTIDSCDGATGSCSHTFNPVCP